MTYIFHHCINTRYVACPVKLGMHIGSRTGNGGNIDRIFLAAAAHFSVQSHRARSHLTKKKQALHVWRQLIRTIAFDGDSPAHKELARSGCSNNHWTIMTLRERNVSVEFKTISVMRYTIWLQTAHLFVE